MQGYGRAHGRLRKVDFRLKGGFKIYGRWGVPSVADEVGAELAVAQVPHLHELVPAARHEEGVRRRGREAHARDPLGVPLLGAGGADRVLA